MAHVGQEGTLGAVGALGRLLGGGQLQLGQLAFGDVGVLSHPLLDVALLVEDRHRRDLHVPPQPVGAAQPMLDGVARAVRHRAGPIVGRRPAVVGMDGAEPAGVAVFLGRLPREGGPFGLRRREGPSRARRPDDVGRGFRERAEARLAVAQPRLGALADRDVGHHHAGALDPVAVGRRPGSDRRSPDSRAACRRRPGPRCSGWDGRPRRPGAGGPRGGSRNWGSTSQIEAPTAALSARSLMVDSARFMWRTSRFASRKPRPTGACSSTPSSRASAARCSRRRFAASQAISAKAPSIDSRDTTTTGQRTTRSRAERLATVWAARASVSDTKARRRSIAAFPAPVRIVATAGAAPDCRNCATVAAATLRLSSTSEVRSGRSTSNPTRAWSSGPKSRRASS